jgi:DNA ligase 1
LASRLDEGANIIKSVYRWAPFCNLYHHRLTPPNSELPNYDLVVPALLEVGIDDLASKCKLTPGVPLKPMLAKPTKAIGEVLDRFEGKKFTCEYKYDGERAQVNIVRGVYLGAFIR